MDQRIVARLAKRQHGVVSWVQLRAAGISPTVIDRRCRRGAWVRLHVGVYAIGHAPLARRGWQLAAVLACGRGALLSHAGAAELWRLVPGASRDHHVTVPTAGGRRQPGVIVHRRPDLDPAVATSRDGVPVTEAAQAILDTAATVGRRATEKMLDQAERQRLCDLDQVQAALSRNAGQRGAGVLRAALTERLEGTADTRSPLEELFWGLCLREGLPRPRVNVVVHGLTVDFHWPAHGVAVETDGWDSHRTPERLQQDVRRNNRLALAGVFLLRFTYSDVTRQAKGTAAQVRSALRDRGPGL